MVSASIPLWTVADVVVFRFQSMVIQVLGQTTVFLLEIRVVYSPKDVFRVPIRDGIREATNTEGTSEHPQSPDSADSSRDQGTAGSTAPQSSSHPTPRYRIGSAVGAPDPGADYLESMDIHSFALQIAEQAPTLEHIGVELYCSDWDVRGGPQMYWNVIRS